MKIQQEIFKQILENSPTPPPEVGGIIGGKDNIITCYFADKGSKDNCYDSYYPDVAVLNKQISIWKKNGIDFYGIFHTHFEGDSVLSCSDRRYIIKIMQDRIIFFLIAGLLYRPLAGPGVRYSLHLRRVQRLSHPHLSSWRCRTSSSEGHP